jgi:hypothetical protein
VQAQRRPPPQRLHRQLMPCLTPSLKRRTPFGTSDRHPAASLVRRLAT